MAESERILNDTVGMVLLHEVDDAVEPGGLSAKAGANQPEGRAFRERAVSRIEAGAGENDRIAARLGARADGIGDDVGPAQLQNVERLKIRPDNRRAREHDASPQAAGFGHTRLNLGEENLGRLDPGFEGFGREQRSLDRDEEVAYGERAGLGGSRNLQAVDEIVAPRCEGDGGEQTGAVQRVAGDGGHKCREPFEFGDNLVGVARAIRVRRQGELKDRAEMGEDVRQFAFSIARGGDHKGITGSGNAVFAQKKTQRRLSKRADVAGEVLLSRQGCRTVAAVEADRICASGQDDLDGDEIAEDADARTGLGRLRRVDQALDKIGNAGGPVWRIVQMLALGRLNHRLLATIAGTVGGDERSAGFFVGSVHGFYRVPKMQEKGQRDFFCKRLFPRAFFGILTRMIRTGIGFDAHRLAADRRLVIGGVEIPHERGLDGHSDADVLAHALMDALLGAIADGDIGHHFPPSDARWKDADSLVLLRQVADRLRTAGWGIVNTDATVLAEAPRLAPFIPAMRQKLAAAMSIDVQAVSVKATTVEGMGAIGRREGISAMAVASVAPLADHAPLAVS